MSNPYIANTYNPVLPSPYRILDIVRETAQEYTFRVAAHIQPEHGQFFQLSIPRVGEAPISVSSFGDGWLDFTIRAVGKVTDKLFSLKPGDQLFMRGPYGNGWPTEEFRGTHLVVIAGGTGVAPVKSLLNKCLEEPDYVKSTHLIIGFKNEKSILFRPNLDAWRQKFSAVLTLDDEKIEGWESGLVTKFIPNVPFARFGEDYNVLIVGPPVMMHFAALECLKAGVPEDKIWVSFERKMSCGIGKCGHCRIDETYVCIEGPVFNYTRAKNLLD